MAAFEHLVQHQCQAFRRRQPGQDAGQRSADLGAPQQVFFRRRGRFAGPGLHDGTRGQRIAGTLAQAVERTGRTLAQVERDCDRDKYMSASQGVEYGLIDRVLETRAPG